MKDPRVLFFVFVIPLSLAQILPMARLGAQLIESARQLVVGKPHEEPAWSLVEEKSGYEIRFYEAANWVCTRADEPVSRSSLFYRLFNYISGDNEGGKKIEMTVPVTRLVQEPDFTRTREMCFYIPEEHQSNPPKPTADNVYITLRPANTFAVRRFTGYASESQWVNEFKSLQEDMQKNGDGESAGKGLIYFSGYNSPMEIFNRRNEIWISMTKAANAI